MARRRQVQCVVDDGRVGHHRLATQRRDADVVAGGRVALHEHPRSLELPNTTKPAPLPAATLSVMVAFAPSPISNLERLSWARAVVDVHVGRPRAGVSGDQRPALALAGAVAT